MMIIAVTLFSVGHHVDHIIRGSHVGWPLTDELTPFTDSFALYPVIIIGLTHVGPVVSEPPEDIIDAYDSPIGGWLAVGCRLLFLLGLTSLSVYAVVTRQRT